MDQLHPYSDDDVPGVIARLLGDRELLDFLAGYDSPRLHGLLPALTRKLTRQRLTRVMGDVATVRSFQLMVEQYVKRIIERSMTSFEYHGIERLQRGKPYLFVSNHRDIAGDSMLVNYALHLSGFETVRIAVGDNLVQRPFATDLMKLNKSFFVKRSGNTRREIYTSLRQTSAYIAKCQLAGESVWIAQAEGRAKDGIDETDPAVIKMLTLAAGKVPFCDAFRRLNVVPVSLSYEFDPCDGLKASELAAVARAGRYQKQPGEDLISLAKGLTGAKGRVRLVFGEPLTDDYENARQASEALDRAILGNLVLFPVNHAAAAALASGQDEAASAYRGLALPDLAAAGQEDLRRRQEGSDSDAVSYLLQMYANPLLAKSQRGLPL